MLIAKLFQTRGEKISQIYSCSIVGCSYTASTLADLDLHLGEHELLDEPVVQYELFRQVSASVLVTSITKNIKLCLQGNKHGLL